MDCFCASPLRKILTCSARQTHCLPSSKVLFNNKTSRGQELSHGRDMETGAIVLAAQSCRHLELAAGCVMLEHSFRDTLWQN